jgi:hypothetical protein
MTSEEKEKEFDALVADIWAMPDVSDQGWADNQGLAIHELQSCDVVLWGRVIDRFLRGYHRILPEGGPPLDQDYLKECLVIVCDEPTQPLTRHIIKVHLDCGRDLSLSELTERRFPRSSKNFGKERKRLRDNILWPMHHIQMWSVEQVDGNNRNGSRRVVCFKISAGPALRRFHERVYFPLRRKQIIAAALHLQREI